MCLSSASTQLLWTHIITHVKWIRLRQDEMEKPKAEVVQEEKPKASVVGPVEPSNRLTISLSGLEDWSCASCAMSFQSIGNLDVTFFVFESSLATWLFWLFWLLRLLWLFWLFWLSGFCGCSGFCVFCDFCFLDFLASFFCLLWLFCGFLFLWLL